MVVGSQGGWTPGIHRGYRWGDNILSLLVYRSIHYARSFHCLLCNGNNYIFRVAWRTPFSSALYSFSICDYFYVPWQFLSCKKQAAENCFSDQTWHRVTQWMAPASGLLMELARDVGFIASGMMKLSLISLISSTISSGTSKPWSREGFDKMHKYMTCVSKSILAAGKRLVYTWRGRKKEGGGNIGFFAIVASVSGVFQYFQPISITSINFHRFQ